jgi:hypothetical protein
MWRGGEECRERPPAPKGDWIIGDLRHRESDALIRIETLPATCEAMPKATHHECAFRRLGSQAAPPWVTQDLDNLSR